jgi:hypothetical protein
MQPLLGVVGSDDIALALHASLVAPLTVSARFKIPAWGLPRYSANLTAVAGRTRLADYGKGVAARIDDGFGFPTFAELLVADRLRAAGWTSAWASAYGGLRFVKSWPWDVTEPVLCLLPDHVHAVLREIADTRRSFTGHTSLPFAGILDVIAWRGTELLVIECKRRSEDRLRATQEEWLHCALLVGLRVLQLGVFEWRY